ncbi:N1221-domain-containing protein [Trichoderma citrinoviride]|uniref:N1221-domain-containing protein n=1 Tax=Trichoderma citrinoviride TaxID=58853 RepID=A0A2T4B0N2_9HYPO|nr:N1221-domain-containing protein [Trichoderma citrinoviride]PTB62883.1 N1221-domain-containing protein [Trichoderma citrinoviride]
MMNSLWSSAKPAPESSSEAPTEAAEEAVETPQDESAIDDSADPSPAPQLPPLSTSRGASQQSQQQQPQRQSNSTQGGASMMPSASNQNNAGNRSQAPQHAPTDSLSLMQLRHIVARVNAADPAAYDFVYSDMGPHAEEIDEWFVYQFWQWVRLNAAQKAFEWHWKHESGGKHGWDDADHDTRARFVQGAIAGVQSNDAALRANSIGKIMYLVLGRWGDTAMPHATDENSRSIASIPQLQAMKAGVACLTSLGGIPVIWQALRDVFEIHWSGDIQQGSAQDAQDELMNLLTIMYIVVQETLNDPEDMASTEAKLLELNPSLVDFMMLATSKLRWDEQNTMPHTQIFLLFWKSILLVFGGTEDLKRVKEATSELTGGDKSKDTITASPLDYHVFRQEVTSKYPAYVPPQPLIPLEADNSSLLPPLPNMTSRSVANGIIPQPPNVQLGGASILNQPVHIATPAPSPPPSPGVGGKGGKKQNYQTNQNFPFMYPPLDATSNSAGGKGEAGYGNPLVSRKWEGSDIPASILEAGQIFSSRVRMTRATRQLWEERERFLKFERGWEADDDADEDDDDDIEDLDLNELTLEEKEVLRELKAEDKKEKKKKERSFPGPEVDFGPQPERLSERDKQRLIAVERFYANALPHLQSIVIVLLRPILVNVTAIVAQQQNQMAGMTSRANNPGINGGHGSQRGMDMNAQGQQEQEAEPSPEEIDATRTREITSKAMTAILLLLLKWLRVSHVLKFEYLTQLLLDSNYLPLVLKLFAHQDIQQVVDSKMDHAENSFFQFCNIRSRFKDKTESDEAGNEGGDVADADGQGEGGDGQQPGGEDSEDDAAPPPIRRQRETEEAEVDQMEDVACDGVEDVRMRPEVDEMGVPLSNIPMEPITDFSRRNFFSLINYLRVMQKICKNKAHRNLLLVQYKSSTILKKSLRVPQPELRLYTLKLFKGQVPYCGRKWRQSNMRVITAVYLHCRPELRDEWLAGSDIDAEVDSALPLEQALRSLTHWLNVRRYPERIAADIRIAMREEQDFFSRELEKADLNWSDLMVGGDDAMSEVDHGESTWG